MFRAFRETTLPLWDNPWLNETTTTLTRDIQDLGNYGTGLVVLLTVTHTIQIGTRCFYDISLAPYSWFRSPLCSIEWYSVRSKISIKSDQDESHWESTLVNEWFTIACETRWCLGSLILINLTIHRTTCLMLPPLQTRSVRHTTQPANQHWQWACKRIPLSDRNWCWRIMVVSIRLKLSHTIESCLTKSTKIENSNHGLYESSKITGKSLLSSENGSVKVRHKLTKKW